VRGLRLHFEDGLMSGAGAAARLLDEKPIGLASYNSRNRPAFDGSLRSRDT